MLTLTPINLKTANAFVQQYHRHHKPTRGHKFSIGVSDNGALVGVAICGRPVARRLDDGYTLEVNRLCTNGTPNACSILYAAAYRAARAMGYNRVVTYILDTENGACSFLKRWFVTAFRMCTAMLLCMSCIKDHINILTSGLQFVIVVFEIGIAFVPCSSYR